MDSLNQQLNQFLSDPNSMRQLQGMLNNLGLGQSQGEAPAPEAPPASSPGPDLSALAGALGALGGGGNASESAASGLGGLNPNALTMATKLAPLGPDEPGGRRYPPAAGPAASAQPSPPKKD